MKPRFQKRINFSKNFRFKISDTFIHLKKFYKKNEKKVEQIKDNKKNGKK